MNCDECFENLGKEYFITIHIVDEYKVPIATSQCPKCFLKT